MSSQAAVATPKQIQFDCTKCQKHIESGNFYTINNFHYHAQCFHCFKCQKSLATNDNKIAHDDKLLVLENGTLICSECSDSCKVCGKKIYDLAIILSNNEAYCPDCFRCTKCDKKITNLKYAKTKNGIFCVDCHQILLHRRKLHKERLSKEKLVSNEIQTDVIQVPIRSPSRNNKNRDNQIYGTVPNTIPKLNPRDNMSSSSSASLLSSTVSNRTTNSTTDSPLLKEQNGLKRPPILMKDPTFSTMQDLSSNYDDAESKTSGERLEVHDSNKVNHTRNVSIDDMLNATLDNDEEFKHSDNSEDDDYDNDSNNAEHDATDRSFFHLTPMKQNMESIFSENSLIDTYDRESQSHTPEPAKIIPQELPELPTCIMPDIENRDNSLQATKLLSTPNSKDTAPNIPLNSPMATNQETKGLALDIPLFTFEDKNSYHNRSTSGGGAPHFKESIQNVFSTNAHPEHVESSSENKQSIRDGTVNSAPPTAHKNKKLNRSFSLKNKFFGGFRNKNSESPKEMSIGSVSPFANRQQTNSDKSENVDTHSGWGVPNASVPSRIISSDKPRNSFKGSSDTLIYHKLNNNMNETDTYNTSNGPISVSSPIKVDMGGNTRHNRSQSTASQSSQGASNIAMFRTPPLDNNAIFKRAAVTPSSTSTDHSRSRSYDVSTHIQLPKNKPVSQLPNTPSTEPANTRTLQNTLLHQRSGSLTESNDKKAAHHRSISWQTALHLGHKSIDEADENTDPNDLALQPQMSSNKRPSTRGELLNYDIKLRNAKLELKSIENSKQELLKEIKSLEKYKLDLIQDIDHLKTSDTGPGDPPRAINEAVIQSTTRSGHSRTTSIPNDTNASNLSTPITITTSSPQSSSKQKFWKLFGKESNPTHQRNKATPLPFSNSNGNLQDVSNLSFPSLKMGGTTSSNGSDTLDCSINNSPNHSSVNGLQEIVLVDLCKYEDTNVPHLITTCIDFIESDDEFLQVEGLYRKSGSQLQIEAIEKEMYGPNSVNYKFSDSIDINIVANILKRFLRNLQNPVIPYELYEPLINFVKENDLLNKLPFKMDNHSSESGFNSSASPNISNHDQQFVKYINGRLQSLLFQQMPREHLNLLQMLVAHVNNVAKWQEENLMSLHNLSLVFTPSLFHDSNFEKDIIDMKERNYLIEYLFTYKIIV
ncbi:hypothetical protein C6P45_000221 [Maudiozyma exigua]|uniref:Rho-GAP domain-containing protein n=1 Tax=Maudiozyma exigua TaxID=34358 RepID=A0A9P6W947_MAUEX|nr:hypothetical protein C6P45_000221 [Kazachstania exigua]